MLNTNPNEETRTILADLTADEIELTEAESKNVIGGLPGSGGKTNYDDDSNKTGCIVPD